MAKGSDHLEEIKIQNDYGEIQAGIMSNCAHKWNPWQMNKVYYEYGPTFESCSVRCIQYVRACSKCGNIVYKTDKFQMEHSWYTENGVRKCLYCNKEIAPLEVNDEIE